MLSRVLVARLFHVCTLSNMHFPLFAMAYFPLMRKYTNDELVQLFDKKDWKTLWKVMQPMVKHAVKRCMQEGLDPFYVRDDLMQEAYLAAWEALPRWNAFEGGLQTWVRENVRGAVLKARTRESSGMIGGRDNGPLVVSMHGESPDDDGGDDEQGVLAGHEAAMVYKDPPAGFGDPADEVDDLVTDLLNRVPKKYQDMVRRLCGIGVPQETQEQYAHTAGITQQAVAMRLAKIQLMKTRKLGNHVMTGRQTRRRAK